MLINKYLKQLSSVTIYKEGPVKRVTSKSKLVYIMLLIDVKYKIAMATQSHLKNIILYFF